MTDDSPNTTIKYNTCSDYDIPINSQQNNNNKANTSPENNDTTSNANNNNSNNNTTSTSASATTSTSSVLDRGVVESRGIGTSDKSKTRQDVTNEIQSYLYAPFSWRREVRSLLSVVMFVTRLPVPRGIDIHPGFLMKGMGYFPLVGALVGIASAITLDFVHMSLMLPISIAACVSTGVGWWLTGCFHEDGLTDSADGIGGGWTLEQILKIMTDSRVGTYGVAVLVLHTLTKVQLLASLGASNWDLYYCGCSPTAPMNNSDSDSDGNSQMICPWPNLGTSHLDLCYWIGSTKPGASNEQADSGGENQLLFGCHGAGPALVLAHSLARLTAPYLIRTRNYVDDEQGPKSNFYAFMIQAKHLVSRARVIFALLVCLVLSTAMYGLEIAALLIVAVFGFSEMAGRYGERTLGGVMGDYLGATICLCELLILTLLLSAQNQSTPLQIMLGGIPAFLQDKRFIPMIRFVMLYGIYIAWGALMKEATFLVDGNEVEDEGMSVDREPQNPNLSLDQSGATTVSPARLEAYRTLSSPTSTFLERYEAIQTYMDALAKPVGSLGTLEAWGSRLAALQRTTTPDTSRVGCLIFAGDHGAAASPEEGGEACSAYPQAVTRSVLVGLKRGVAGASVLAKANNVKLRVVDVGVVGDESFNGPNVFSSPSKLAGGTKNFCKESAMTVEEAYRCIRIGREQFVQFVEETKSKVVCLGEVGIGNTTSSSAVIAALAKQPVDILCGGGAFATRELQEAVVTKKIAIVKKALAKHYGSGGKATTVLGADVLTKLGGAEIAALVGAMLEASERNIALLVDGFIVTAAALVAVCISPDCATVMFFTSRSAEKGQQVALEQIQAIAKEHNIPIDESPILSMDLRMGEATAALLAVPILRSSAAVLSDMATIQEILS